MVVKLWASSFSLSRLVSNNYLSHCLTLAFPKGKHNCICSLYVKLSSSWPLNKIKNVVVSSDIIFIHFAILLSSHQNWLFLVNFSNVVVQMGFSPKVFVADFALTVAAFFLYMNSIEVPSQARFGGESILADCTLESFAMGALNVTPQCEFC